MIRLLFLLTLGLGAYMLWRYLMAVPAEKRRSVYLKTGLWALVIIAVLLTVTGRMHWVGCGFDCTAVGCSTITSHADQAVSLSTSAAPE